MRSRPTFRYPQGAEEMSGAGAETSERDQRMPCPRCWGWHAGLLRSGGESALVAQCGGSTPNEHEHA